MSRLILLVFVFILVGCSNNSTIKSEVDKEVNKENIEVTNEPINSEKSEFVTKEEDSNLIDRELNREFEKAVPNAKVLNKKMFDITEDGVKDLIVIYDTSEQKANFAIISKESINAITLNSDDTHFQFANGKDSLRVVEEPNRMIITLFEPKKNLTVEFEILMEYDKVKNDTNIIIKSKEIG